METRAAEIGAPSEPHSLRVRLSDAFGRQQGYLFVWMPICLGVGIGIYFSMMSEPSLAIFAPLVLALLALWLWAVERERHRGCWASVLLWAMTLVVAGSMLASFRAHWVAAPVLGYRYYGPIEGRVIKIDKSASQKTRLTLDQVRLTRMAPARTPKRVRISLHGPMLLETLSPGDVVMVTGHLGPPSGPVEPGGFDFQRHLWFQQLGALGYTRTPLLRVSGVDKADLSWRLQLYSFRLSLSAAIKSRMPAPNGPFAAAIITGDRTDIDAEALGNLRASNLAHLLAISGLHMGLLTGAVFALIRIFVSLIPAVSTRLNARKVAAVGAFAAALVYLGVSGASVATQRAFIMVSVMLFAICIDRPALSLRAVAIAALAVLIMSPEALIGPGFQMSFAATTALVAVFAVIRDRSLFLHMPGWMGGVASLVISSFIAGAATAPFGAAHFNQLAQYGLLANLLSVPVMGLIVMPGAIAAGLLAPLGLEWVGLWVMEQGLAWILGVADFVATLDGSTRGIIAPGPWVLPLVSLGGLFICIWQGRGRMAGLVPLAAAVVLWVGAERPVVLISESGRLLGVLQDQGRILNKPKGDSFSARVWLENDADIVTQAQAAARGDMHPNVFTLELAGGTLGFDAQNPDKIDVASICASNDLVVLPRVEVPLPKSCVGWVEGDFSFGGSVAIYTSEQGLRYEDSRTRQGDRLWVLHRKRKRQ